MWSRRLSTFKWSSRFRKSSKSIWPSWGATKPVVRYRRGHTYGQGEGYDWLKDLCMRWKRNSCSRSQDWIANYLRAWAFPVRLFSCLSRTALPIRTGAQWFRLPMNLGQRPKKSRHSRALVVDRIPDVLGKSSRNFIVRNKICFSPLAVEITTLQDQKWDKTVTDHAYPPHQLRALPFSSGSLSSLSFPWLFVQSP